MNKTKLGHGRMRRDMGLHMPKEPNKLNEALNLVCDLFPASNFSWNSCEHVCLVFSNAFTSCHKNTLTDYILNLEE